FSPQRLEGKRRGLLHELVPTAKTIAVLINPDYSPAKNQLRDVQEAAARLGVQVLASLSGLPPHPSAWPRRWLPALPIRKCFGQGETSRPGLDWCRSSIRVEARTGSAASASKVTVICVACSRQARLLSFAMPRSMAPSIGLGSRRYWRGGPPRSPLLRLPTNSRGWPGP